eukprot:scaffold3256_cov114-Isochrysis_galbana.AAC.6
MRRDVGGQAVAIPLLAPDARCARAPRSSSNPPPSFVGPPGVYISRPNAATAPVGGAFAGGVHSVLLAEQLASHLAQEERAPIKVDDHEQGPDPQDAAGRNRMGGQPGERAEAAPRAVEIQPRIHEGDREGEVGQQAGHQQPDPEEDGGGGHRCKTRPHRVPHSHLGCG